MEITLYLGEQPLVPENVTVKANGKDRARVTALVNRAAVCGLVEDDESFRIARRLAGEIRSMEEEITSARKMAKAPYRAVETAIDELAKEIAEPLLAEKVRVAKLLAGYVERLEAEEAAKQAAEKQRLQAELAQQQAKLAEAQAELRKAQATAQAAQAATAQAQAERAQLAMELAQEAARIGKDQLPKGKVPGGRVTHPYDFKLVDIKAVIEKGNLRCLKWTIDKLACSDIVRAQEERGQKPFLPGIEITRLTNVTVKPIAHIE